MYTLMHADLPDRSNFKAVVQQCFHGTIVRFHGSNLCIL